VRANGWLLSRAPSILLNLIGSQNRRLKLVPAGLNRAFSAIGVLFGMLRVIYMNRLILRCTGVFQWCTCIQNYRSWTRGSHAAGIFLVSLKRNFFVGGSMLFIEVCTK
jgi:hypothetical protein